ncbi:MAG: isoprenyl transferase [Saprospiraceae bacterium]
MEWSEKIDKNKLPQHIAVIMDGNGRWAKQRNRARVFGHKNGVKSVREVTEAAAEIGIAYLTLYAFSTENWKRPKLEVDALMRLLVETLSKEVKTLNKNDIRLQAIGDLDRLPKSTHKALLKGIEDTKNNQRMVLTLALNYSAKWELTQAMQSIGQLVEAGDLKAEAITESLIGQHLSTKNLPDPELLIRTSGESRLSNFMLWQLAYAELYFTDVFWPDFRKPDLFKAIFDYQNRERRFGMISEQIL